VATVGFALDALFGCGIESDRRGGSNLWCGGLRRKFMGGWAVVKEERPAFGRAGTPEAWLTFGPAKMKLKRVDLGW
jgi:hypothetical protein